MHVLVWVGSTGGFIVGRGGWGGVGIGEGRE